MEFAIRPPARPRCLEEGEDPRSPGHHQIGVQYTIVVMLTEFALEGHRVRLEPLTLEHASGLAAAAEGDRATYGLAWVPDGLHEAQRYVETALKGRDGGRQVPFAVRDLVRGQIAGSVRYLDLDVFPQPAPWPPV